MRANFRYHYKLLRISIFGLHVSINAVQVCAVRTNRGLKYTRTKFAITPRGIALFCRARLYMCASSHVHDLPGNRIQGRSIIFDWRSSSTLAVSRAGLTSFVKAVHDVEKQRGWVQGRDAGGRALSEIPGNDKVSRRSLNPFVTGGTGRFDWWETSRLEQITFVANALDVTLTNARRAAFCSSRWNKYFIWNEVYGDGRQGFRDELTKLNSTTLCEIKFLLIVSKMKLDSWLYCDENWEVGFVLYWYIICMVERILEANQFFRSGIIMVWSLENNDENPRGIVPIHRKKFLENLYRLCKNKLHRKLHRMQLLFQCSKLASQNDVNSRKKHLIETF